MFNTTVVISEARSLIFAKRLLNDRQYSTRKVPVCMLAYAAMVNKSTNISILTEQF